MEISLQNCGKNFHRTWLFRGLNIEIDFSQPQRIAILGANGSGKSTFCLMLIGQVAPTEGTLQWYHNKIPITNNQLIEWVSLASPALEFPEEFTLKEWFDFHNGIKKFASEIKLSVMMELCGFSKSTASKSLLTFSSGMKQRVKLCMAMLGNEKLVILDEPLTNLDELGEKLFYQLIDQYGAKKSIIIASNRRKEYQFCDSYYQIGDQQLLPFYP